MLNEAYEKMSKCLENNEMFNEDEKQEVEV